MGHNLHHAIIVTSWDLKAIAAARRQALSIGLSATSAAHSNVNSYATFTVVPDGSKSGWKDDEEGDLRRDLFITWLHQQRAEDGSNALEWVEVSYGSDDREAKVTRHEWQDTPAASAIAAAPEDKAKWVPCPATRDGWICVRHDGHKGAHESVKRTLWPNEACEVCHGAGQVEGTAGVVLGGEPVPAMRLCPECSTSAFERLRAKLAAAPEAPAWLEKLRVATNRMVDAAGYAASSLLSDVDIDLKDVRDFVFALREQVESHARRIEALERAAQDGGQ